MTNMVQNVGDSLEVPRPRSENDDSTSSELERLDNDSPCPSGTESPTERGIAKTKKQEDNILRIIDEAKALGTNTIDLSNKGMRQFPSEILEMPQLEYVYLEGNELRSVPDELFDKLSNLKWLDLRRNYIVRLPSIYTGRHEKLRNLLLEGNNLRTLPLELGLIKSLHGLNINNNPLEFPPPSVIEKGTAEIMRFLREMILAKSAGKSLNGTGISMRARTGYKRGVSEGDIEPQHPIYSRDLSRTAIKAHSAHMASQQFPLVESDLEAQLNIDGEGQGNGVDDDSSSSDDWGDDESDLRKYAYRRVQQRSLSTEAARRQQSEHDQLVPMNKSAELHRPMSYTEIKQTHTDKLKRAGAMGTIDKRKPQSATSVLDWRVNQYPEPPPQEYIDFKQHEERQMAKAKELKEKTDAILQRRQDEELLKGWRRESKRLQQKKYFESIKTGKKDFLDPVQQAPFDIDKDYIKIPTNAERIKQDVKSAHEKIRRKMSPASQQRMEEEKAQRIMHLEKRIKQHTSQMHERRKMPKGTPHEEMEAARRELEVAEALHRELIAKRKEVEYRFRAFTADLPSTFGRKNTLKMYNK